jgi:hypothetical protein
MRILVPAGKQVQPEAAPTDQAYTFEEKGGEKITPIKKRSIRIFRFIIE